MEEHAWILSKRGPASQPQPLVPGRGADPDCPTSDFLGEVGNPGFYMKSPDFLKNAAPHLNFIITAWANHRRGSTHPWPQLVTASLHGLFFPIIAWGPPSFSHTSS